MVSCLEAVNHTLLLTSTLHVLKVFEHSKRAARTTRPTSVLDGTKPIGERGKNSRPCLIVSQAAYLITRIPDIGLPGRAARELIWSQ